MSDLAVVMPFYRNGGMLRRQLDVWRHEWPDDLKGAVEIVLVDDGSPQGDTAAEVLAEDGGGNLPALSLYRILIDKPWNQHGARNLGAKVAHAGWLLMTDMDHVIPADTLAEALRLLPDLKSSDVLTFGRVDAPTDAPWRSPNWRAFARTLRDDGTLKPHVNSFAVARKRYWSLGGYDESFTGYGTDSQFRRKIFGAGMKTHHLHDAPLIRVDRAVIPDASTTTYSREKQRCDVKAVKARKALQGRADEIVVLNFPWERVTL